MIPPGRHSPGVASPDSSQPPSGVAGGPRTIRKISFSEVDAPTREDGEHSDQGSAEAPVPNGANSPSHRPRSIVVHWTDGSTQNLSLMFFEPCPRRVVVDFVRGSTECFEDD